MNWENSASCQNCIAVNKKFELFQLLKQQCIKNDDVAKTLLLLKKVIVNKTGKIEELKCKLKKVEQSEELTKRKFSEYQLRLAKTDSSHKDLLKDFEREKESYAVLLAEKQRLEDLVEQQSNDIASRIVTTNQSEEHHKINAEKFMSNIKSLEESVLKWKTKHQAQVRAKTCLQNKHKKLVASLLTSFKDDTVLAGEQFSKLKRIISRLKSQDNAAKLEAELNSPSMTPDGTRSSDTGIFSCDEDFGSPFHDDFNISSDSSDDDFEVVKTSSDRKTTFSSDLERYGISESSSSPVEDSTFVPLSPSTSKLEPHPSSVLDFHSNSSNDSFDGVNEDNTLTPSALESISSNIEANLVSPVKNSSRLPPALCMNHDREDTRKCSPQKLLANSDERVSIFDIPLIDSTDSNSLLSESSPEKPPSKVNQAADETLVDASARTTNGLVLKEEDIRSDKAIKETRGDFLDVSTERQPDRAKSASQAREGGLISVSGSVLNATDSLLDERLSSAEKYPASDASLNKSCLDGLNENTKVNGIALRESQLNLNIKSPLKFEVSDSLRADKALSNASADATEPNRCTIPSKNPDAEDTLFIEAKSENLKMHSRNLRQQNSTSIETDQSPPQIEASQEDFCPSVSLDPTLSLNAIESMLDLSNGATTTCSTSDTIEAESVNNTSSLVSKESPSPGMTVMQSEARNSGCESSAAEDSESDEEDLDSMLKEWVPPTRVMPFSEDSSTSDDCKMFHQSDDQVLSTSLSPLHDAVLHLDLDHRDHLDHLDLGHTDDIAIESNTKSLEPSLLCTAEEPVHLAKSAQTPPVRSISVGTNTETYEVIVSRPNNHLMSSMEKSSPEVIQDPAIHGSYPIARSVDKHSESFLLESCDKAASPVKVSRVDVGVMPIEEFRRNIGVSPIKYSTANIATSPARCFVRDAAVSPVRPQRVDKETSPTEMEVDPAIHGSYPIARSADKHSESLLPKPSDKASSPVKVSRVDIGVMPIEEFRRNIGVSPIKYSTANIATSPARCFVRDAAVSPVRPQRVDKETSPTEIEVNTTLYTKSSKEGIKTCNLSPYGNKIRTCVEENVSMLGFSEETNLLQQAVKILGINTAYLAGVVIDKTVMDEVRKAMEMALKKLSQGDDISNRRSLSGANRKTPLFCSFDPCEFAELCNQQHYNLHLLAKSKNLEKTMCSFGTVRKTKIKRLHGRKRKNKNRQVPQLFKETLLSTSNDDCDVFLGKASVIADASRNTHNPARVASAQDNTSGLPESTPELFCGKPAMGGSASPVPAVICSPANFSRRDLKATGTSQTDAVEGVQSTSNVSSSSNNFVLDQDESGDIGRSFGNEMITLCGSDIISENNSVVATRTEESVSRSICGYEGADSSNTSELPEAGQGSTRQQSSKLKGRPNNKPYQLRTKKEKKTSSTPEFVNDSDSGDAPLEIPSSKRSISSPLRTAQKAECTVGTTESVVNDVISENNFNSVVATLTGESVSRSISGYKGADSSKTSELPEAGQSSKLKERPNNKPYQLKTKKEKKTFSTPEFVNDSDSDSDDAPLEIPSSKRSISSPLRTAQKAECIVGTTESVVNGKLSLGKSESKEKKLNIQDNLSDPHSLSLEAEPRMKPSRKRLSTSSESSSIDCDSLEKAKAVPVRRSPRTKKTRVVHDWDSNSKTSYQRGYMKFVRSEAVFVSSDSKDDGDVRQTTCDSSNLDRNSNVDAMSSETAVSPLKSTSKKGVAQNTDDKSSKTSTTTAHVSDSASLNLNAKKPEDVAYDHANGKRGSQSDHESEIPSKRVKICSSRRVSKKTSSPHWEENFSLIGTHQSVLENSDVNMDVDHVQSDSKKSHSAEVSVSLTRPRAATRKPSKLQRLRSSVSKVHPLAQITKHLNLDETEVGKDSTEGPSSQKVSQATTSLKVERSGQIDVRNNLVEVQAKIIERLKGKECLRMAAASSGRVAQLIDAKGSDSRKQRFSGVHSVPDTPAQTNLKAPRLQPLVRPEDRIAAVRSATSVIRGKTSHRGAQSLCESSNSSESSLPSPDVTMQVQLEGRDSFDSHEITKGQNSCKADEIPCKPALESSDRTEHALPNSKSFLVLNKADNIVTCQHPLIYAISEQPPLTTSCIVTDLKRTEKLVQETLKQFVAASSFTPQVLQKAMDVLSPSDMPYSLPVIVRDIVKIMNDDYDTPLVNFNISQSRAPPLTPVQQQLLTLIHQLSVHHEHLKQLPNLVLRLLEYRVFRLGKSPEGQRLDWCVRLYTAICRVLCLRKQVLIFCWDAMYALRSRSYDVINTVFDVWPHVFPINASFEKACPNFQVMVHLLRSHVEKPKDFSVKKRIGCGLKSFLNKPAIQAPNINSSILASNIFDKVVGGGSDINVIALVLLAKREEEVWALANVVAGKLLDAYDRWRNRFLDDTAGERVIWAMCSILRALPSERSGATSKSVLALLISELLQKDSESGKPVVLFCLTDVQRKVVLNNGTKDVSLSLRLLFPSSNTVLFISVSPHMQEVIAMGLAILSRHDIESVAAALTSWNPAHGSTGYSPQLLKYFSAMINCKSRSLQWWNKCKVASKTDENVGQLSIHR